MFQCRVCGQIFYSTVDCNAHREDQHPDSGVEECIHVQYRCGYCGQVFGHVVDCRNHTIREHGVHKPDCRQEAA